MLMFDAIVPVATVGAAVGAAAGNVAAGAGGAGTTRFSVDPDQAQNMIKGLKDAVDKLIDLKEKSRILQQTGAPGPDPYSGLATLKMRETAGDNPGGYGWANEAAQKALLKTIENIEKALADYRSTDDAAKNAVKG
jgi:hypothetical protein